MLSPYDERLPVPTPQAIRQRRSGHLSDQPGPATVVLKGHLLTLPQFQGVAIKKGSVVPDPGLWRANASLALQGIVPVDDAHWTGENTIRFVGQRETRPSGSSIGLGTSSLLPAFLEQGQQAFPRPSGQISVRMDGSVDAREDRLDREGRGIEDEGQVSRFDQAGE